MNNDKCKKHDEKTQHEKTNNDITLEGILNYLETIYKNVNDLNRKIKEIQKSLDLIKKDNPYKKLDILSNELITIYASEKRKKSVNINSKILDKTLEVMKDKLNIKNNKSLAINTALLIALYQSNLDLLDNESKNSK